MPNLKPRTLSEQLMKALSFNEKDLELNRQFKLSGNQKKKLTAEITVSAVMSRIGTLVCFIAACSTLIWGVNSFGSFIAALASLGGFGFFFFWAFSSALWQKQVEDFRGVKILEGKAEFEMMYLDEEKTSALYLMRVGGIDLTINENIYNSAKPGNYRVYYFQKLTKSFLSIEDMD